MYSKLFLLICYRIVAVLPLLWPVTAAAQNTSADWIITSFRNPAFIENRGQYSPFESIAGGPILYCLDDGAQVFFTTNGFTYYAPSADDQETVSGCEIPNLESCKKRLTPQYIRVTWVNCLPEKSVVAEQRTPHYWNYLDPLDSKRGISLVPGYEKLTYLNLYDGIDLEFTIHPDSGFKYTIIVHPGANYSDVQFHYSDGADYKIDEQGNFIARLGSLRITDRAPSAMVGNTQVSAKFSFANHMLTFVTGQYDTRQALVIDPWVTTSFLVTYVPTDIGTDASDNVCVSGYKYVNYYLTQVVMKYDADGVLQWIFDPGLNPAFDSTFSVYIGDIAVDADGNTYISCGLDWKRGDVKLDPAGSLIWSSIPVSTLYERWRISLSGNNLLAVAGCDASCCNRGGGVSIDPITGAESIVFNSNPYGDVISTCFGRDGFYYALSTSRTIDSTVDILRMDPNWGFLLLYSVDGTFARYEGVLEPDVRCMGINAIAAGSSLYINTSLGVEQRDLQSGQVLNTVDLTGGSWRTASGLAIDACDNVFAGSSSGVERFDANLQPMEFFTTPFNTNDVAVGSPGTFFSCGGGGGLYSVCRGYVARYSYITCPDSVQVPNVFTPNGDANNDFLTVTVNGFTTFRFDIYDRWGAHVFSADSTDRLWDGTHNGNPCAAGTYYYTFEGVSLWGTPFEKSGFITLVR